MALTVATADDVSNEATTSAVGPFRTSHHCAAMSVDRGKADLILKRGLVGL